MIAALLLAVLLLLIWLIGRHRRPLSPGSGRVGHAVPAVVTAPRADTTGRAPDTALHVRKPTAAKTTAARRIAADTAVVRRDSIDDTSARTADTSRPATDPCARDTTPPWAYLDPAGGLHRSPVSAVFSATKPCRIDWRRGGQPSWRTYAGEEIRIAASDTIFFRAIDSCGRRMTERFEAYSITPLEPSAHCPADMEYITISGTAYCIDRYEWPDVKGRAPMPYVSVYQAMDSCFAKGKRLCSSDEWMLACAGPYSWRYTYGQTYEPRACVTHDTAARPSGSARECRGYFDVYDMSGNLAEWTNTRSLKNHNYYTVMGGFWESGAESGCGDSRYSYYPQNRHNPVGFRCCKDAAAAGK